MTEKRFKFISDSVAQNLKTPICDNGQPLILGEVLDKMNELSRENEQLQKDATTLIYANQDYRHENEKLKSENKRLTDKLNETALEFLNHDMVTMGKATEISEMCYYDFLKFRKEHGNPMELQE